MENGQPGSQAVTGEKGEGRFYIRADEKVQQAKVTVTRAALNLLHSKRSFNLPPCKIDNEIVSKSAYCLCYPLFVYIIVVALCLPLARGGRSIKTIPDLRKLNE